MKKPARLIVLLFMLIFTYGCTALLIGAGALIGAGVGVGTYKYVDGRLARNYPVEYSQAWEYSNTALENLFISLTDSINEGTEGKLQGVKQDGTKVIISLKDKGQGVTYISVRVGLLGDRKEAERIHDEIAMLAGI
jgi:hypothetical protein